MILSKYGFSNIGICQITVMLLIFRTVQKKNEIILAKTFVEGRIIHTFTTLESIHEEQGEIYAAEMAYGRIPSDSPTQEEQ